MSRPLLPSGGYAYVSIAVLFELGLPPVVRDTYTVLRALAWGTYETPALSWEQLVRYAGKERKTLYRHMLTLAHSGVLSWRPARVGTIIVTFSDGVGGADTHLRASSQNRELPDEEEVPQMIPDSLSSQTPPLPPPAYLALEGGAGGTAASQKRELPAHVRAALEAAGVFPAKIDALEAAGVTEAQIAGHLADGAQGGILVYRLTHGVKPRSGARAVGAACPQCGRAAGHARDCGARYVTGEFAEYIEH